MHKTELAYVAGLIDGEGTVTIAKVKRTKSPHYQLHLRLEMTHRATIERAQKILGGVIKERAGKQGCKRSYRVVRVDNDAYLVLKLLQPYLTTKAENAALGILLRERGQWGQRRGSKGCTEQQLEIREDLWQQVKVLNK
jgi:hypothetical protein